MKNALALNDIWISTPQRPRAGLGYIFLAKDWDTS